MFYITKIYTSINIRSFKIPFLANPGAFDCRPCRGGGWKFESETGTVESFQRNAHVLYFNMEVFKGRLYLCELMTQKKRTERNLQSLISFRLKKKPVRTIKCNQCAFLRVRTFSTFTFPNRPDKLSLCMKLCSLHCIFSFDF